MITITRDAVFRGLLVIATLLLPLAVAEADLSGHFRMELETDRAFDGGGGEPFAPLLSSRNFYADVRAGEHLSRAAGLSLLPANGLSNPLTAVTSSAAIFHLGAAVPGPVHQADGGSDMANPAIGNVDYIFDVPEPGSWAQGVLGAGFLAALALARRKGRAMGVRMTVVLLALFCCCCCLTTQTFATTVIAPNALPDENNLAGADVPAEQTYGDTSNLFPFFPGAGNALQYQQVFDASQFAAFAAGGETITQLSFRVGIEAPGRTDKGAFTATIPAIQITLSTTGKNAGNLSTTFTDNTGTDAMTVYGVPGAGAPLMLTSVGATTTGATTPAPFDVTILLTTGFHYDPAQGNLLLSVVNYDGAASPAGIQLDGTSEETSTARVLNFGSAMATTATGSDTEGLVTEFTTGGLVPEPGSRGLLLSGAVLFATLLCSSRKRQRLQDL